MLSWFRFAIFVVVFIPPYFSITNCFSNTILVTRTISPVNDTTKTSKTNKFESISDITLEQLKLRPIIDQTGTYIYKASEVVAKYLGPLAKNEYTIRDTLSFPDLLKSLPSDDNYQDVSYDLER